jgi:methionyl-tRNA formyltransferase
MTLRFAFLMLHEHPYGREMLRILLEKGFRPGIIVEETSEVANKERDKFLTRIGGQPVPPTMAQLITGLDIPHRRVSNHNSPACHQILEAFKPELVVLGGTRILRPSILAIPRHGTVNAHPGLLPHLRGSSSVAWALYRDLPVASTTHFVDEGIDTGPIILQRALPVRHGDTYEQIVRRMLTLSGELMAETLALFEGGQVQPRPQDRQVGETLQVISPALLAEAKTRLAQGRYRHFEKEESNERL